MSSMSDYDYKTALAPVRAGKFKGVRDADERLERTLSEAINAGCAGGWEFFGTETVHMEEGGGLFSKPQARVVTFLVFTRPKAVEAVSEPRLEAVGGDGRLGPAS